MHGLVGSIKKSAYVASKVGHASRSQTRRARPFSQRAAAAQHGIVGFTKVAALEAAGKVRRERWGPFLPPITAVGRVSRSTPSAPAGC